MSDTTDFEEINGAKASMDHIYDRPDPRAYFQELVGLNYRIPDAAKPIFKRLISRLESRQGAPVRVLDIGSSYGVNAALLKYDLSMADLYHYWGQERLADAATDEVLSHHRRYLESLNRSDSLEMIGLDTAENAVTFAERAGLIDGAIAANLENEAMPEEAAAALRPVALAISTGCVGYVTEKSFARLLAAFDQTTRPWLANFVLRIFPFTTIAQSLSDHGYVTEKLDGHTFAQRQFASQEERDGVLENLRALGIDPTGHEADGHLVAEFYLSRPAKDAEATPLTTLLNSL